MVVVTTTKKPAFFAAFTPSRASTKKPGRCARLSCRLCVPSSFTFQKKWVSGGIMCSRLRIKAPSVHRKRWRPRSRISRVSEGMSGYFSGSPPQMATTGASHSSKAARHCSTVNISLLLGAERPFPPLAPPQLMELPPRGSNESITANLCLPRNFRVARCLAESKTRPRGYRIRFLDGAPLARCIHPLTRPEIAWLEFRGAIFFRALGLIAIARQCVHRERILVEVILQIEDARKTGAREVVFTPRSVGVLLLYQVGRCPRDRRIIRIRARHQPDQAPSRLRRGAVALPLGGRRLIAMQRLAETSVGLLYLPQPAH